MAQITIKGFIASDIKVETVGSKGVQRVRVTVIDESRSKSVGFFVDFWRDLAVQVQQFKKGSRVMIKAVVEDGSYDKEVDGVKKKIYGYNFNARQIIPYVENADEDLDREFERQSQAANSRYPGLTPTDEPTPYDEKNKK